MAEEAETGEKRRRSTRNRTESAIKRQAVGDDSSKPKEVAKSTPTRQPPKSTPTSKASEKTKTKIKKAHVAPIVIEDAPLERVDVLPSKLVEGKPFPTLRELPKEYGSDYQSVKESGVLAAALARSRQQWTRDGVFEKYWTKPPPKKKQQDPAQPRIMKPPGEKVGQCDLVVEPHCFNVTLYIVKENIPPPKQQHQPQYHQYAPSYGQAQVGTPNNQQPPRPIHQSPHPPQPGPYHQHSSPRSQTPNTPNNPRPIQNPTPPNPPPQQQQQQANTPDPVIQMLAQRASTNPELKSVMKIVATGSANQEQLDYFQKHIDELNKIVAQQRSARSTPAPPPPRPHQPNGGSAASPTATPGNMAPPAAPYHGPSPAPQYPPTPSTPSYGPPAAFTPQPYYPPQPPQRYAPAAAHPQSVQVSALLIEFAQDATSRFRFPAYSILEYLPGFKTVVASFLIKRKAKQAEDSARYINLAKAALGDQDAASKKPEEMDFWQPVTVRFMSENPNVLQWLGRVTKPAEEVRNWMEKMLNGEAEQQKPVVKSEAPKDAGFKDPNAASSTEVKEEPKENPIEKVSEQKALPKGVARAESRRLAMRLPKEDKGKENVEA